MNPPTGGVPDELAPAGPDAPTPPEAPRRWWRRPVTWIVAGNVAALLLLAFVAGAWHFSNQIASDALLVEDDAPEYEVSVADVGGGSITFTLGDDPEDDLLSDELLGVALDGGYGQVSGAATLSDGTVTRDYLHLDGTEPAVGGLVDLQGYAYPDDPRAAHGIDFSEVTYRSPVGELDAWLVPGSNDRWVIMVHGRGAHPREALRMLPAVTRAGHPALIIFYRNDPGQPATDDRHALFGLTEWEDLEGAVRFAVDNGADDVVVFGASMGGAIAAGFMVRSELADEVVALVLDSPALDLGAMVDAEAAETNLPVVPVRVPNALTAFAKWMAGVRFDLDWGDLDYLDRADELDVPILLFHGDDDGTVPVEIGDALAAARPDVVTYVRVPDAGHVRAWNVDPERYDRALAAFLAGLE